MANLGTITNIDTADGDRFRRFFFGDLVLASYLLCHL